MRITTLAGAGRNAMPVVVILSGTATVALAAMIGIEVVARKLFDFSLQGVDEIGGYVLAVISAFGFTFALIERAHTRIDLFLHYLPRAWQAALHVFAIVTLFGFAAFMAARVIATLWESLEFGSLSTTPLQLPLWIPQGIWAAGLVIFAAVAGVLAIRATVLLIRAPDFVAREFGPPRLEIEIQEHMKIDLE